MHTSSAFSKLRARILVLNPPLITFIVIHSPKAPVPPSTRHEFGRSGLRFVDLCEPGFEFIGEAKKILDDGWGREHAHR